MSFAKTSSALALAAGILAAGSALRGSAQVGQEINWASDWDSATVISRQTGKPLFVAFR